MEGLMKAQLRLRLRWVHSALTIFFVAAPREARKSGVWWVMTGSNCRPSPCKGDALPTELITQKKRAMTHVFGLNVISDFGLKCNASR